MARLYGPPNPNIDNSLLSNSFVLSLRASAGAGAEPAVHAAHPCPPLAATVVKMHVRANIPVILHPNTASAS